MSIDLNEIREKKEKENQEQAAAAEYARIKRDHVTVILTNNRVIPLEPVSAEVRAGFLVARNPLIGGKKTAINIGGIVHFEQGKDVSNQDFEALLAALDKAVTK